MSLLDESQPEASACPQKEQPVSNFVVQAYEPTKKLFKQPIGRPKMRKHGRPRAPRVGDDMTGQPWHIVEKTKLLTAIRRFGFENVEVLSDMVKTRSKDEVETFIKKINSDAPRPTKKKKKAGGRQKFTPRDFTHIGYFHKFNFFDPNIKKEEATDNENKENENRDDLKEENTKENENKATIIPKKERKEELEEEIIKDASKNVYEENKEITKDTSKNLCEENNEITSRSEVNKSIWYREDTDESSSDEEDWADPIIKKSPIELWSELIHEITINEPYDFSQDVSKVFNMIAKFEEFQPSGLPRLNWKKMYQFLADLLEDKAELQELSDVESHILIDMMQGLGDVLHSSDTHLQHRLLTLKFSMLDGDGTEKTSNPRRQDSINRAFNNDFDYKGDGTYTGPRRKAAFRKSRESSESGSVKEESIGAGPSRAADETDDDIAEFKKPQLFTLNPLCIPTSLLPLKPRVDYFDS